MDVDCWLSVWMKEKLKFRFRNFWLIWSDSLPPVCSCLAAYMFIMSNFCSPTCACNPNPCMPRTCDASATTAAYVQERKESLLSSSIQPDE
jgi:hypothetical protein